MEKRVVLSELLGEESPSAHLDCQTLQRNSHGGKERQKTVVKENGSSGDDNVGSGDGGGYRIPTAIATIPEQGLVVIGFDSGEVQCYSGLPGELSVGSGFRVSRGDPVRFVRTLEKHVTIDSDLLKDEDDARAVFYVSCGADVMLWLCVDGEVRFPWIRYIPTPDARYRISDALLCAGMPKMVAATSTGKLLLYDGRPPEGWQYKEDDKANKGQQQASLGETQKAQIVKVAHEGFINCLATNNGGDLLLSCGTDGRIALWQWGQDQFLHQAASLFITNIPIRSAFFLTDSDHPEGPVVGEELSLALTLDSHVMGVRAVRRSRQAFKMEQEHHRHFVMPPQGGRVFHQCGFQPLVTPSRSKNQNLFLALRSKSGSVEVVGDGVAVAATPGGNCQCFDHREGSTAHYQDGENGGAENGDGKPQVVTAVAMLDQEGKPEVRFWLKE